MSKVLNRFSRIITQDKTQGASQAMLYALKLSKNDLNKGQVGIGSNWFESNPCNSHLNKLSEIVKNNLPEELLGFQFNTIGVSDGISMGTKGMLYSLPSRELIADSYETINYAHSYDANISIPGCDKNLPGCLMGMIRINRPSLMIYGGTIKPGRCYNNDINIVDAFQSYGRWWSGEINDDERLEIIQSACPGPGSCGGMYTANTMATAIEAMGMSLPFSSSNPAGSKEKHIECANAGTYLLNLMEKDIKPKDIITRESIENAITTGIALGGSTNLVLHILAIAKTANIDINIDIFNEIGTRVPVIGNFKPHGEYLMNDLHFAGGTPNVLNTLLEMDLLHKNCLTVTGKTLEENIKLIIENNKESRYGVNFNNIVSHKYPIKKDSHIRILYGNLAPKSAVAKITGKEGNYFEGKAKVYNSENEFMIGFKNDEISKGDVIIIRNQGPVGGPGMPEMLKPTSAIAGSGLENDIAFLTDGRFSGGSHGFIIGHITPEAALGGPIGKVKNGDLIKIDTNVNEITWTPQESETCINWKIKDGNTIESGKKKVNMYSSLPNKDEHIKDNDYLKKFRKLVNPANLGCTTV